MSSTVEVLTQQELGGLLSLGRRDIAEFEQLGYATDGGLRVTFLGFRYRSVLMTNATRDRGAAVFPTAAVTHYTIGSDSPSGRTVVSRNIYSGEQPPWELTNDLPGATPSQLDAAHSGALELVGGVFGPEVIPEGRTMQDMADSTLARLRLREPFGLNFAFSTPGMLSDDAQSARRIERWLAAEPPRT